MMYAYTERVVFWVLTFCLVHVTDGYNLPMGNLYVLAFPRIPELRPDQAFGQPGLTFNMHTMSRTEIKIRLTVQQYNQPNLLDEELAASFLHPVTHSVDSRFGPQHDIGVTSTFRLASEGYFSTTVFLKPGGHTFESLQAFPVTGWGKTYFAFTFIKRSSINIVTELGPNEISIQFKFINGTLVYEDETLTSGSTLRRTLQAYQGFVMSWCSSSAMENELTGTKISGHHNIGVITGSCDDSTHMIICEPEDAEARETEKLGTANVLSEMLPPLEAYGKEFMTLMLTGRRVYGKFVVVASEDNTQVLVHTGKNTPENRTLQAGERFYRDAKEPYYIRSSKAILVIYIQMSACVILNIALTQAESGDPAMCVLVPMQLFYDTYVWSAPTLPTNNNFIAINIKFVFVTHLRLNERGLSPGIEWLAVQGYTEYRVGSTLVHAEHNELYSVSVTYFAVYAYGIGTSFAYMHPLPYVTTHINTKCDVTTVQVGDFLDNDCDDKIDEETRDNEDNDNDGRIDEDLSKLSRQNGGWSPWVYTECSRNCSDYKRTASRKCDKPETQNFGLYCEGVGFELQEKGCHVTLKCPGDCPLGTWDFNCKGVCLNCHPDCDKWNGTCQHCTRGHKLADGKCEHVCTAGTYGFACGGNCLEKCGTDCIDRVHGKCPGKHASNSFSYFWLGVLSLPLLMVLVLYLRIRDRKEMEALKSDDTSQNNL